MQIIGRMLGQINFDPDLLEDPGNGRDVTVQGLRVLLRNLQVNPNRAPSVVLLWDMVERVSGELVTSPEFVLQSFVSVHSVSFAWPYDNYHTTAIIVCKYTCLPASLDTLLRASH